MPHPDDEVVGFAIAVRRAVAQGRTVFALYLTTGVPAAETLWPWQRADRAARIARRRREADEAAWRIGLSPLAFAAVPSRRLKTEIAASLTAIRAAVAAHGVAEIWVPGFEGAHQDHDVANFLAAQMLPLCPVREFAEYNFAGGRVNRNRFPGKTGSEETIRADAGERVWKRALLDLYRSERGNLRHVGCESECSRPLQRYDYAARPHAGRLFYERFQWLPFRHPRVDFDPPESVAAALAAFSRQS